MLANVSYRPMEVSSVAEMLDLSRPLVKSQQRPTRPVGPTFVDPSEAEKRKQQIAAKKVTAGESTSKIYQQKVSERKFLKAQYEFDREKRLAEQNIYRKEKEGEWKNKFATSPFLVDLVADNERIEEEITQEERRQRKHQEVTKKRVKADLERTSRRMMVEEERRQKALRDLERVEQLWERKQKDAAEMAKETSLRRQRIEPALVPPRKK